MGCRRRRHLLWEGDEIQHPEGVVRRGHEEQVLRRAVQPAGSGVQVAQRRRREPLCALQLHRLRRTGKKVGLIVARQSKIEVLASLKAGCLRCSSRHNSTRLPVEKRETIYDGRGNSTQKILQQQIMQQLAQSPAAQRPLQDSPPGKESKYELPPMNIRRLFWGFLHKKITRNSVQNSP